MSTESQVLKMTKPQLITFVENAAASFGETHVLGLDGWSKDELQREALDLLNHHPCARCGLRAANLYCDRCLDEMLTGCAASFNAPPREDG